MGPFQVASHVVQNRHVGEPKKKGTWTRQIESLLPLKWPVILFVCRSCFDVFLAFQHGTLYNVTDQLRAAIKTRRCDKLQSKSLEQVAIVSPDM